MIGFLFKASFFVIALYLIGFALFGGHVGGMIFMIAPLAIGLLIGLFMESSKDPS